ncbi:MAG: hypothetical protein KAS04_06180, partial [Candidatus Aenigmarchaeota archaeon]|nr:hypothetical protein [Candidatus Aenigmarchaeota archaeon]
IMGLEAKTESKQSGIRVLRDRIAEKNSNISYLRSEIKDIKVKLSEHKENEMEMKKLLKILGKDPEKTLESMLAALEDMRKGLYIFEGEKVELENSLKDLKTAKDVCPLCESYLKKERKQDIIEHKIVHIGEIEVKINGARGAVSRKAKELNGFRKSIEKYKDISMNLRGVEDLRKKILENESKIDMIKKEIEKIIPDIQNNENDEKGFRKTIEKLKVKQTKLESLLNERQEIEDIEKEIGSLRIKIREFSMKRKELEKAIRGVNIKTLRTEQQEVVGLCRGYESEIRGIYIFRTDRKISLKDLNEQKKTFDKYVKEVEKFASMIDYVDKFVSVLKITQDQLRDEFLKTVNYIMNDMWSELYPYSDFSTIQMAVEKDYVLQLKSTKGWVNADVVSGGERSLAALALRIAFSLAFTPNLRWLILDEPTHNLDRNAINHFGTVLRDRMGDIIDQVFLITHEERLSDYITGQTYRLERNKDVDGATKIDFN